MTRAVAVRAEIEVLAHQLGDDDTRIAARHRVASEALFVHPPTHHEMRQEAPSGRHGSLAVVLAREHWWRSVFV